MRRKHTEGMGSKPVIGSHDSRNLHLEGHSTVVLEGPLEAAAYITTRSQLEDPWKVSFRPLNQVVLNYTSREAAENCIVIIRSVMEAMGNRDETDDDF